MSLYDEAAVALIAEGAAGKDGVLYNIKPEEKLKATELVTNGGFIDGSGWEKTSSDITFSDGKAVFADVDLYHYLRTSTAVFEKDKTYKVSFTITDFTMVGTVNPQLLVQESDNQSPTITSIKASGQYSFIYKAKGMQSATPALVGTPSKLVFKNSGADASNKVSFKLDNVSVKEVEQAPLDFTFTRGSNLTATRVAPSGYIEKGRENVLQNSNDFSVAGGDGGWIKGNATVTSGHTGYDGSQNAWKLSSTVSTSFNNIEQNSSEVSGIADYGDKIATFSVYLKKGNTDWARVNLNGTGNVYFDLSGDGAVGTASSGNILGKIEKIGSGWFRCSVTRLSGNTFTGVLVYVAASDGNLLAADHSESKHIFVQNAQLEYGLVATEYIESYLTKGTAGILEDSPRFDYLDVTCPHLLMEPTRKNLVPHSEYFTFEGRATITYNHDTSPEGVENSTKFTNTTETGAHRTYTDTFDVTSGNTYTASVFAKKGSLKKLSFKIMASNEADIGFDEPIFNLDDETIGGDSSNASMVDYGNGWYRCIVTSSPTSTPGDARVYFYFRKDDDTKSYTGTTSQNMEIYGAQVEEGYYATSYIPNHGTSGGVTRLYDTTDSLDFGDYMDGDDVTLFVDLAKNPQLIRDGGAGEIRLSSSNKTAGSIKFYRSGDTNLRTVVYFADLELDNNPTSHIISDGTSPNIAVRRVRSTGEFTVFYDGAQQYQAFNTNYDVLDNILIRGDDQPIFINSILLFDRALTDDECKSLAT